VHAKRVSRLVLFALAGAVLLHCALGIVVMASAGRFAWAVMAHRGLSEGGIGATTAKLGAAWLAASIVGLAVAARLLRGDR
jgi:hypothetical protein